MRHLYISLVLLLCTAAVHAQSWDRTYGGDDADGGYAVAPMPDGGFVAGGYFGIGNSLNGFVVRTDAQGDTLWTRVLDRSALDEYVYDLVPTGDGGVLVIGAANFLAPVSAFRPWLVRLDASGEVVFSTDDGLSLDIPTRSAIIRGAQRPDGSFVIVGGSNTYTAPYQPWRALVGADGSLLDFREFSHLIPGFGSGTYVEAVRPTPDGGFAVSGSAGGGLGEAFLWKFDAAADSAWVKFYGGEGLRTAYSVRVGSDGAFALSGCALPNCSNAAVVRAEADGSVRWTQTYPDGELYTEARDLALGPDGSLLVLRTGAGAAGSRSYETDLLELDADGTVLETIRFPGGPSTTGGLGSVFLDRVEWAGGDGWFVAVGRRFDNGNPSKTDLYLVREQAAVAQTTASDPALPEAAASLAAYPNPVADRLTLNGLQADDRVQVYDLLGRVVAGMDGRQSFVDVRGLPGGVYLVRVTGRDGQVRQTRITVQR